MQGLEGIKVLYAEDEKELREIMVGILDIFIGEIYIAKDGEEAYKLYKEKKPDIIVSDIHMPKLNGIDFIKKVREEDHNTRVIMLTAHSDVNYLLESTELKLTKYLLKPIRGKDLEEALRLAFEELKSFKVSNIKSFTLQEGLIWDFKEQLLLSNNEEIHLTPKERKILQLLFSNLNKTITYDLLIDEVWEEREIYGVDSIKTMIKNLRKKLPKNTIINVYGTGFKVIK